MRRTERRLLHFSQAAVGVTGLAYGICLYLLKPSATDEAFAVVNHPWQPLFLHSHVLAAPLAIFGIAYIWQTHIQRKLRGSGKRRLSGSLLVAFFVPLIASGYAIQVVIDEEARRWTGWIHAALSLLWVTSYLFHLLRRREAKPVGSSSRKR